MKTSPLCWIPVCLSIFFCGPAFAGEEMPEAVVQLFQETRETRFESIRIVSEEQEVTDAIRLTQVFHFPGLAESVEMAFFYKAQESRWVPMARPEAYTVLGDGRHLAEERAAFERLLATRFSADLIAGELYASNFSGFSGTPLYFGGWLIARKPQGEDIADALHLTGIYVIDYGHTVAAFPSYEAILSSEVWVHNHDPDYRLRSADDAARFQQVLECLLSADRRFVGPFQEGQRWFFPLRENYSAQVLVDPEGRIEEISFLDRLALPQQTGLD